MANDINQNYLLSSVKNALLIMRSFTLDEPEKKVTDLANSLNLGKSTVSRLLSTLASEGFVVKNPETNKYRLGLTILNLNTIVTNNLEINRESQPILKELVNDIGETAHIAVLEGSDVVYLYKIDCKHPVQILTHIGKRNPVHATSSGKVLLAHQSEDTIQQYIENGLYGYKANTITDPEKLRDTLQLVRKQGYATSSEELLESVASVAAPVRDYTGKVVYSVSVTGPVHRMNPKNPALINRVKRAAQEISENLGCWNY
ncbi:IclR family transcriptional regulator [Domibacillus epiphyticus]|uniref:Glycerol operon regulatory protein n=1 Tax=Domibacillus epiphyticus TaxID=1714355 RepID=A0A1V2A883_9BACI|nr:IclR family transcriptional regulator [Domibacillus epiphyticus]OMP67209.1 IclR family transcriptional regulator [Domibacillus epiphyticus]